MMRMLVSVKNVPEALAAAQAGADFIDLKDPAAGALGGLAPADIATIVAALRAQDGAARRDARISATIGDLLPTERHEILARVAAVAATGVDYVKVGIDADAAEPGVAEALLAALARCEATVVPVLIADHGIDLALVHEALAHDRFPALMVDTADKRAGSLLQRRSAAELRGFIAAVRARGALCGLAGALRAAELPMLAALAPDFAGFRSAVCAADRAGALEAERVAALRRALSLSLANAAAQASNAEVFNRTGSRP